jgi:hypothetical protein
MTETSLQHDEPVAIPARSFGKQVRSMAGYTIVTALMFMAPSPLSVFIPAALLHCGIRNGRRAAWLLLVLSAVIAALLIYPAAAVATATESSMIYGFLLGLFLAIGVPALAVQPMVERGQTFGRVLISALVLSVIGLFATELTMRSVKRFSPYAAHLVQAHEISAEVLVKYQKAGVPADGLRTLSKLMDAMLYCLPGSVLVDVAIAFVLSLLVLGRLWAWRDIVRRSPPAANPYRLRNLSLPEWLLFAFVIGGLSPLASGMVQQIGANVLAVVAFLYFLQGLAIFRSFVAATGAGVMGSFFAWSILGFLMIAGGVGFLLLFVAGLFDSFFDFRHFNRKDHSDESHSH